MARAALGAWPWAAPSGVIPPSPQTRRETCPRHPRNVHPPRAQRANTELFSLASPQPDPFQEEAAPLLRLANGRAPTPTSAPWSSRSCTGTPPAASPHGSYARSGKVGPTASTDSPEPTACTWNDHPRPQGGRCFVPARGVGTITQRVPRHAGQQKARHRNDGGRAWALSVSLGLLPRRRSRASRPTSFHLLAVLVRAGRHRQSHPGPGWRRLRWAELARRTGGPAIRWCPTGCCPSTAAFPRPRGRAAGRWASARPPRAAWTARPGTG